MSMMRRTDLTLDSHQHFWRLERGDYGWLKPQLTSLYRDFEPEHLAPTLKTLGVKRTILVQAAPTVAETRFLMSLAHQHDFIAGVVGWVDFEDGRGPDVLEELCRDPKFVGVRPMLQDIADPDWLLRPELQSTVDALIERRLTFDALVRPHQLRSLVAFCEKNPDLNVVLDHAAKPNIAEGRFDSWAADLRELAKRSAARCKLSGLITEARAARLDLLVPYVEHILECFGPARIMWGSDWPVCESVCSYSEWFELSHRLLNGLTPAERAAVYGAVAHETYGLAQTQRDGSQRHGSCETLPALLLLHPDDNVFVARRSLSSGELIVIDGRTLQIRTAIPLGHKVARRRLAADTAVVKYGAPIGSASGEVAEGEHLHLHNLRSDYLLPHAGQSRASDPG